MEGIPIADFIILLEFFFFQTLFTKIQITQTIKWEKEKSLSKYCRVTQELSNHIKIITL